MKTELDSANIIGYYELRPNQTKPEFKIRDKRTESNDAKGSQIKTGSICNNDGMKKSKIIDYIKSILNEEIEAESISNDDKKIKKKEMIKNINNNKFITDNSVVKSDLCKYLELKLRYKDVDSKEYRYFYGPEETIEYKLTEKVFWV